MLRTRFAPSPTGYMHIGNLRTALYTYLLARAQNGKFILRIEDTDQERLVDGATEVIYRTLAYIGLTHDEGPDIGGPYAPYIQSQRKDMYQPYAKELIERGGAYPCFCTKERLDDLRAQAEAEGKTFKYDKHCLHLDKAEVQARMDAGESYVVRQNVPLEGKAGFDDLIFGHIEQDCAELDDNVLIKSDGLPTYNFANVVDDHTMDITHVLRGAEYLSSAPKYNLLYDAFGWKPPVYIHVSPVMKDHSRKLSKRHGDPSFEDLLAQGFVKDAIVNYVALLGWNPGDNREFFTLDELVEAFSTKGLSKSPAIFDIAKLTFFNAEYIRKMPEDEYDAMALPWLAKTIDTAAFDTPRLCRLLQGRTEVFSQLPDMVTFLTHMPAFSTDLYTHKKMKTDPAVARTSLTALLPVLEAQDTWTESAIHDTLAALVAELGCKNGQLFWPLRIAITGLESTPGGAIEMAYLLGKEETLKRLRLSLEALKEET